MLLDRAHGQHYHAIFGHRLADFRPGEFFVSVFGLHSVKLGEGAIMAHRDDSHGDHARPAALKGSAKLDNGGAVRPRTAVLTRGFDPTLSLGSARPAVFRSSTYVFESPEAAEHAFAITTGKIKPEDGARADLIYSRFSHPNAEILEDQIVPLEAGARE